MGFRATAVRASDVARNARACAWTTTGDERGQRTSRRANIISQAKKKKNSKTKNKRATEDKQEQTQEEGVGRRETELASCVAFVALSSPFYLVLIVHHNHQCRRQDYPPTRLCPRLSFTQVFPHINQSPMSWQAYKTRTGATTMQ